MKAKELFGHITKHMAAEEALMKILEGSLIQYEKLKFDEQEKAIHPVILISMAAMDMGWQMAIEKREGDVRGITVGTEEYLEAIFSNNKTKI